MIVQKIALKNFMVFDNLEINFNNGVKNNDINIIIGENGTGKTTLLKCIYAACESSNLSTHQNKAKRFQDYFSSSSKSLKEINQKLDDFGLIQVFSRGIEFHYRAWDDGIMNLNPWLELGIKSVFIPAAEMLSHSKGLVSMANKYNNIPFDHTQIDILINAQLWETKDVNKNKKEILQTIESEIGGKVIYEEDMFYVVKNNGLKVEFSLEARGYCKLGLLWKLISNGLLEENTVLLWDEPENSLNPELIPMLVDILFKLSRQGVQIFLATHDYNLMKYFSMKKKDTDSIGFFSLYKTGNGVFCDCEDDYTLLEHNAIVEANTQLVRDNIKGVF